MTATPLVLHVIHHLGIGGLENGLVNLINGMPESRFRHAIACIEDYSDFRQRIKRSDVEVFALRRSSIGVWSLRRELYSLCRRLRPAIVHSRNMSGLDAVVPAFLAGVRHYVHGEHGWDVNDLEGKNRKQALLRKLHSPFVDRYITVSKHLKRYLIERVGISESRITQIYNGVDTVRFAPAANSRHSRLPDNFADSDSVVIGTVGRIQEIKDQETLVRAFASICANDSIRSRARLVIAGDGPLLSELQGLAQSLGIAQLTWFTGATSDVPEIMRTLDVFVLPSLLEGISNTILEAMATGLPVIASAVGGNVELVDEGETGQFIQPRDVQGLARRLNEYMMNPELRKAQGCRSRQVAEEKFGLNIMIAKYQDVYEHLCRNGRDVRG